MKNPKDMTTAEFFAALSTLPGADLIGETKLDGKLGDSIFFDASTVLRLLFEEREACAAFIMTHADEPGAADWLADQIRAGRHRKAGA